MPLEFKKITIIYADRLYDTWEDLDSINRELGTKFKTMFHQSEYMDERMSNREEYVQTLVKGALKRKTNTAIFTNDYYFMRLLEFYTPGDQFCIYSFEDDEVFNQFVDLKYNPTLKLANKIFTLSVKQAMKKS